MIVKNHTIRNTKGNFDITGDKEIFHNIVNDMLENAGNLRPEPNWDLERGGKDGGEYFRETVLGGKTAGRSEYELDDKHYDEHFSNLKQMMEPWIGCTGENVVDAGTTRQYIEYLHEIDHIGLLENHFDIDGNQLEGQKPLMITDLGSIMDINLITSTLMGKDKLYIVEVGGGYGRLAEAFMHVFGPEQIRYVLIDAVPASLMYAHIYLEDRFPQASIGSCYHGDKFDLDKYHCYVVSPWIFDKTNTYQYDVSINIQSMQEMGQEHVDHYLALFNSVTADDGMIYLSNEKDYVFRGDWNYPKNWNCIYKQRTPRSWTRNSPTEIFINGKGDYTASNRLMDFMYHRQLQNYDKITALTQSASQIQTLQRTLDDIAKEVNLIKEINSPAIRRLLRKI